MKVVLIYQKYTQALENNFKNAEKNVLRKWAVLTSKADYNGMATSNQGFFPDYYHLRSFELWRTKVSWFPN